MQASANARQELRRGTADCHQRVDDLFSEVDLATRGGYGRYLVAQAAAHLPVEQALDAAGANGVVVDWDSRRRSELLLEDLADLGLSPPPPTFHDAGRTDAAIIGGVYVLEGSRLGGALLRRSVAAGLPARFLTTGDASGWRRLLQLIEGTLRCEEAVTEAVLAARAVFATFERAGHRYLRAS